MGGRSNPMTDSPTDISKACQQTPRRLGGCGGPDYSADLGENATHLFGVEGPKSLGAHRPPHADAETDGGGGLLIGSLHDAHQVVAPLRPQECVHAAAHLLNHLPDVFGALR